MQPYSIPVSGYVALWPYVNLGKDKAIALYSVGCRTTAMPLQACGFAISFNTNTAKAITDQPRRLMATTLLTARVEALAKANGRPAVLLKAIAIGRTTVWERMEVIAYLDNTQAEKLDDSSEISFNGTIIEKAFNPRVNTSLSTMISNLSKTVTHDMSKIMKPALKETLENWAQSNKTKWSNMTPTQFDAAWEQGSSLLSQAVTAGLGLAAPGIKQKFEVQIANLHKKNQIYLKNTHIPRIQVAFNQVDEQVLESISEQAGFWIRDGSGAMSNALSKKGRAIIQDGVRDGIGNKAIADNLVSSVPGMWKKYGFAYASTVTSNVVSRARSYSEASSYASAGITYLEVMAMLDEVTTDYCRLMDGTIVDVQTSLNHMKEAASVKNPEDIKAVSPFFESRVNQSTKEKEIFIGGTNNKFATVKRSGIGNLDDRGSAQKHMSTKALNKSGITMPGYHHRCRTMTVPRTEMVQVPSNYEAQTEATPSTNDQPVPKKPTKASPKPKQQQRPVAVYPQPKPKKPITIGQQIPIDKPVKPKPKAKPKKTVQKPKKSYPSTLQEQNQAVKDSIKASTGKDVTIEGIKLNTETLKLEYKYKDSDGKKGKYFGNLNLDQVKSLQDGLKQPGKKKTPKKQKDPKPAKHPVKDMKKPTLTKGQQQKENERTKKWNFESPVNRNEVYGNILENLKDDEAFNKMLKQNRGKSRTPAGFADVNARTWNATSRDKDKKMHYLQMAVAEEFGLPKETMGLLRPEIITELKGKKNYQTMIDGYKSYARAQYNETQKFLKKNGVTHVSLARGISLGKKEHGPGGSAFDFVKKNGTVTTQPISSYSTSVNKAVTFSGNNSFSAVTRQSVPRERIFGTYSTGLGTSFETEFVVLGGHDDYTEHLTWGQKNGYVPQSKVLEKVFEK